MMIMEKRPVQKTPYLRGFLFRNSFHGLKKNPTDRTFFDWVLFGMLFLSSCSRSGSEERLSEADFLRIDVDNIELVDSLVAEDVLEDYRIIKLETNINSLIGEIHKILFEADRFFVLDISIAKNILVFDKSGKHLYNVGYTGQGPGEYLQPMDIAVDSARDELIVYDQASNKLLIYDLTGKFKREHRINLLFRSIEYINSDTILGLSHNVLNIGNDQKEYPYDLLVFNRDGAIRKNYLFNNAKMGKGTSILTKNRYFSKNDRSIFLSYLLIDTIYTLEEDYRPVPKYVLNFDREKIEKKDLENLDKLLEQLISGEKRGIWRPVSVTNNHMLISFTQGIDVENPEDTHRVLIQFPDRYVHFKGISFKDLAWSFPIATKGEYFVSSIPPQKIGKDLGSKLGMEEQDNPALLLYKFKQSD